MIIFLRIKMEVFLGKNYGNYILWKNFVKIKFCLGLLFYFYKKYV